MRNAVVALVRSAGYETIGFASAEDLLASGTVQRSACIISDIQMPGMTGIELKEYLTGAQNSVPVIMITAHHEAGLEGRAIASGAAGFLRKPFDGDVLINSLS